MPKVNLGTFTDEDMVGLLRELLDTMPEGDAFVVIRDWARDNDIEGELA